MTAVRALSCGTQVEEDKCQCLWEDCGNVSLRPDFHRQHEAVHTGIYPFNCATCNKGFSSGSKAKICCVVMAACRCGAQFKGQWAKRNCTTHFKKCRAGAVPRAVLAAD